MKHFLAIAVAFVAVLGLAACGGSSSSPTTPTTPRWQLTGVVRLAGSPVSGAALRVVDGPDAGSSTTSDANGRYTFATLQQGTFTVQTSAACCVTSSQAVTLTGNQTVDVNLSRLPRAELVAIGGAEGVLQADGSYDFPLSATNNGPDCATAISGEMVVSRSDGSLLKSVPWSLPAATVIGPNQTFTYHACCMAPADAFAAGSYFTKFAFTAVACP